MTTPQSDTHTQERRLFAFRFSIRSLFILTAVVAVAAWWLASPTAMAQKFAKAVNQERYDQAADLFVVRGANSMLTEWKPLVEAHALPTKLTLMDLVRGRRAVHLTVTYESSMAGVPGFFPLEADYRGIHLVTNLKASSAARFKLQ